MKYQKVLRLICLLYSVATAISLSGCSKKVEDNVGLRLPENEIFCGVDGLDALTRAVKKLPPNAANAMLLSAFATDYKSYIDAKVGLQYFVITSWSVNFYSRQSQTQISFLVTKDQVRGPSTYQTMEWSYIGDADFPKIGNQQALELASQKDLLHSNLGPNASLVGAADVPTLRSRLIRGNWRNIWELPYGGTEFPIWIDAISGTAVGEERFP